ncbi:MAG: ParB/RepB/Spo0J family partition protein [Ardenticatenaceae bacterium]|nr:ParB/RepB/Spo0J family partition protein [Ardenticatenaceae bacterium]
MARKKPKVSLGSRIPPQTGDLEKLFGSDDDVEQAAGLILLSLKVDAIQPDPNQPRNSFPEDSLAELAESIRQDGIIQPIEVTEIRANQYMIVHGERRWRASQLAGLDVIPAVVRRRNYDEITRFVRQLVENIQREDLNDVDRAYGMVRLRDLMQAELDAQIAEGKVEGRPHAHSISWAKVGERLGFTRQRASQIIQLLDLPDEIKDAVRNGRISERDTRILRGLKPSQQRALFRALEAGDVDSKAYRQVARYLKQEAPELTVHEAIRILDKPLPPARAMGADEDEDTDDMVVWGSEAADAEHNVSQETGLSEEEWGTNAQMGGIRVTGTHRLLIVHNHLTRITTHGLARSERQEMQRLLREIAQDIAALLTALEDT